MSTRYLICSAAVLAALVCGQSQAALIQSNNGTPSPTSDWIEVFVDEFFPGPGMPTTWGTRDGVGSPYDHVTSWLSAPTGSSNGRETFWVPKSQPTFYLEGYNPPNPEPELGDRGLTFHSLATEVSAGANYVTIDPSNIPGQFVYTTGSGSRTVNLTVLPRTPEPSSALLAVFAAAAFVRCRHR